MFRLKKSTAHPRSRIISEQLSVEDALVQLPATRVHFVRLLSSFTSFHVIALVNLFHSPHICCSDPVELLLSTVSVWAPQLCVGFTFLFPVLSVFSSFPRNIFFPSNLACGILQLFCILLPCYSPRFVVYGHCTRMQQPFVAKLVRTFLSSSLRPLFASPVQV